MNKMLKIISIFLGFISIGLLVFMSIIFLNLQPKMIHFEAISQTEESLFNWIGVALLVILLFFVLSLLRLASFLKKVKKMTVISVLALICAIVSLLFVFSDIALISDIVKQYKYSLSQPEWFLLYPMMSFQFIIAVIFTYLHIAGFRKKDQVEQVTRDSHIFLIVQYVGLICGLMGLIFANLSFVYSKAWNVDIHVAISSIILLSPYVMAVLYWLLIKLQEKPMQWVDEKQLQDVGKSAFLTLILNVILMTGIFIANYENLRGIISISWLPIYLFSILLFFSAGNLYFAGRNQ